MAPVPEDDFDNFTEAAHEAANTTLPHDDFDDNPFGHDLGMDADPELQTAAYTEAQLAGPPDAIWLGVEDYSETEEDFLTNIP